MDLYSSRIEYSDEQAALLCALDSEVGDEG